MTLNPTEPDSMESIVEVRRQLCRMVVDLSQAETLAQRQAAVARAQGCIEAPQRQGLLSDGWAYRLAIELEALAERASPGSIVRAPCA